MNVDPIETRLAALAGASQLSWAISYRSHSENGHLCAIRQFMSAEERGEFVDELADAAEV
jgi:hypothetical protein